MGLICEWAGWEKPESPPFVLEADRSVLAGSRSVRASVAINGWTAAHTHPDFCAPGDKKLHLGLLPVPFIGDLNNASVYVLMLNPSLGPGDYFGENEVPAFREALFANLKQQFAENSIPFFSLDPQFAWHGGFSWWHGKLGRAIKELAIRWAIPFAAARARLARKLACIELLPYHSASFRDADGWVRRLESVNLARAFVKNVVVPRVEQGEAIAIVTRSAQAWDLPPHPRIVRYSGPQARGAHLSPDSPGGKAILEHLGA